MPGCGRAEAYQPTEVYRFRPGPIEDLTDDGTMMEGEGPEARINGWPLGEALIDYVAEGTPDGDPGDQESVAAANITGNIISDTTNVPMITKEAIMTYVEFNDDRNIGTGYHAIEFLLWGQDLNEGQTAWTSPRDDTAGQRPVSDYYQDDGARADPFLPTSRFACGEPLISRSPRSFWATTWGAWSTPGTPMAITMRHIPPTPTRTLRSPQYWKAWGAWASASWPASASTSLAPTTRRKTNTLLQRQYAP